MQITRNYVTVRISKAEKDKKKVTEGKIIIPETIMFMRYNLQWGRVMSMGTVAAENYPDMEVGDTALFHHTVEDGDDRLLEVQNNGDELRYLDASDINHSFEIYAVVKPNGRMIPARHYIVVDRKMRPLTPRKASMLNIDGMSGVDLSQFTEDDYLMQRIANLEQDIQQIMEQLQPYYDNPSLLKQMKNRTYYQKVELPANMIVAIRKEMHELTRYKNTRKLHSTLVNEIHDETSEELSISAGDRIVMDKDIPYPIEYREQQYLFVSKNGVEWRYEQ